MFCQQEMFSSQRHLQYAPSHTLRHEYDYASCSPLPFWPFHQRNRRARGDARLALQKKQKQNKNKKLYKQHGGKNCKRVLDNGDMLAYAPLKKWFFFCAI